MKVRSETSRVRTALLLTSALLSTGVVLSGTLPASAADMLIAPDASGWYYTGGFEAGGRIFIQRPPDGFGRAPPPDNWLTPRTTDSRAKFEEYGEIPPGVYLEWLNIQYGTRDGRYYTDIWADNAGFNNQRYTLDWAEVGKQYLTLGWDQIPHLLSTSAKTIFQNPGSTSLTVNDTLQATLQANVVAATLAGPGGQAARTNIENAINANATQLTLETLREKAFGSYRSTPNDAWDFKVEGSSEHRTGTRPISLNWGIGAAFPTNIVEMPMPLDDWTHNASAQGQYIGTSFWGQRWSALFKYSASLYEDDLTKLEAENPFCLTAAPPAGCQTNLRLALPPSNQAHAFLLNTAVDLPSQSRWLSTVQYNFMRQNDSFVETNINGLVHAPWPETSLNGKVNTLLVNESLISQLTSDLKSTLRYRLYDVDNQTPEVVFTDYIRADSAVSAVPRRNLALAYTRQNANVELAWRATKRTTYGLAYLWEQYDRTRRDADVTNEHTGKLYVTTDVLDAGQLRASTQYGVRRYRNYDALTFVKGPGLEFSGNVPLMRKFDMANRDRLKAEVLLDVPLNAVMTATPVFGLRNDWYPEDVVNQLGLRKDVGWNAGLDLAGRVSPDLKFMVSYVYERRSRDMRNNGVNTAPQNDWSSDINQNYHTFIAALDVRAIPDRLDFRFEYLFALGSEENITTPCPSGNLTCTGGGVGVTTTQFPTETNKFQRFSALAKYYVDPSIVKAMGWQGDVTAKLRYIYEQNHRDDWAIDNMTPYIPTPDQTVDLTGGGRSIFLAYNNPNYTAQLIAASLAFKW